MPSDDTRARLRDWFAAQLRDATDVRIDGLDRVTSGHSAETLTVTLVWRDAGGREERLDVVLRLRPPTPGLLEPYDLERQFTILRALESTPVPAPRAYWSDPTGTVFGRDFYVMERLDGTVYEKEMPADLATDPARATRMARSLVETLAEIHQVDVDAAGLRTLASDDHVGDQLAHWTAEMRRVQLDPLPALQRVAHELAATRPAPGARTTLVHGDAKPGNYAYTGDRVSAVFDWELATVGDPRTDIGYLECMWGAPGSFTAIHGCLPIDDAVALHTRITGIEHDDRAWFRALAGFKLAVIMLVGSMLFDRGASDDLRFAYMGYGIPTFTDAALRDLRIDEPLDHGPVRPRRERVREVRAAIG